MIHAKKGDVEITQSELNACIEYMTATSWNGNKKRMIETTEHSRQAGVVR